MIKLIGKDESNHLTIYSNTHPHVWAETSPQLVVWTETCPQLVGAQ